MGIECISCTVSAIGLTLFLIILLAIYIVFWVQAIKEWWGGERIGVGCMIGITVFGFVLMAAAICEDTKKAQQTVEARP